MRQRNDTGYPLNSPDVGRVIWPGEKFSFPHRITGCTVLNAAAATSTEATPPKETPESPALPVPDPAPKPKTTTGTEGEVA